ncbi:MAG: DeoR/GlpR family DNA-binding transcription regulator, partial [Verrucomicrobiota bacterium]|nr:DeoR/GlpR family DNA-binding transcription regulator [Verrucomicrobiota bacterium]
MLAPERYQQILGRLEARGVVRTIDLAKALEVTDETIRRDLQILETEGKLTRVHGGASNQKSSFKLRSFNERQNLSIDAKQAIAKAALSLIQPQHTYAFDSSTTALALVTLLPNQPYRVITNAHAVMEYLKNKEAIELVSTGGRYHPKTNTYVGGYSMQALSRHKVHAAFVSCIGFDLERGASEGFEEQASYKERLTILAEEVILLVDSSKFESRSEYFFAATQDIDHIICDHGISSKFEQKIRSMGIRLTI